MERNPTVCASLRVSLFLLIHMKLCTDVNVDMVFLQQLEMRNTKHRLTKWTEQLGLPTIEMESISTAIRVNLSQNRYQLITIACEASRYHAMFAFISDNNTVQQ